jgi:hypothetical protein
MATEARCFGITTSLCGNASGPEKAATFPNRIFRPFLTLFGGK